MLSNEISKDLILKEMKNLYKYESKFGNSQYITFKNSKRMGYIQKKPNQSMHFYSPPGKYSQILNAICFQRKGNRIPK